MLKDIRYALRMLRKNPGFTAVAICSLAIGIGATSAIYTLADGLLLRPLPVPKPSEVVTIRPAATVGTFGVDSTLSYPDYVDLRDQNRSFTGLAAAQYTPFGFSADRNSTPQRQFGMWVSGNTFDLMHVPMAAGRGFRPEEDKVEGRDAVVVLGYKLWQSEFHGDPSAVGKRVRLNGIDFTVVGVAPEKFSGIGSMMLVPDLYVPLAMSPRFGPDHLTNRGTRWLTVKGRLRPGVNRLQAQDDLNLIAAALAKMYPATNRDRKLVVRTELQFQAEFDPTTVSMITMLGTLAACVLLVACANAAGLLLSRSNARAKEIAVRLALGASRLSLVRQLLIENFLLALAGGAAGLFIAYAGMQLFRSIPAPVGIPISFDFALNRSVLLFTLGTTILTTLLFGLTPALRSTRPDLVPALKTVDPGVTKKRRLWGRNAIVVGQVALSLVLLSVAGVLIEGFRNELAQGPGFRTDHLFFMSLDPSLIHYTAEQRDAFYQKLLDRTRTAPGVLSAALCSSIPMSNGGSNSMRVVPENLHLRAGQELPDSADIIISDKYFETLRIPIVQGRPFLATDKANTPAVAIVNEQFAHHYWPHESALGKRMHLRSVNGPLVQIVGITKTAKYFWIAEPPMDFFYLPFAQNPQPEMTIVAESATADAAGLAPVLRRVLQSIDRQVPTYDMRTVADLYASRAVKTPNIILTIVTSLGVMGLVLAVVGLYGLVAYSVSRQYREIGIRMAVGADRKAVLRMVLKRGLILGITGTAIGLTLGLMAGRAVGSMATNNFGHISLLPFPILALLLLLTTLLAAYVPARRAARIDPMRALREE